MASPTTPQNPFLSPEDQTAVPSAPRPGLSSVGPSPMVPSAVPPKSVTSAVPRPSFPGVNQNGAVSENKVGLRRFFPWIVSLAILLILGGGVYFWLRSRPAPVAPLPQSENKTAETTSSSGVTTQSTPEVLTQDTDFSNYRSENFKMGEIAIGGEAEFLSDENDVTPLEISNIRGEAFTEKNKQEVKLVVTWSTNRLSIADVHYSKGVGQTEKTVSEDDYSFNHSMIIAGLDPASTYLYTIESRDRYGNQVKSEPHAVFTGARSVSLFDLIAGAIGEVFGWAVSK